MYIPAWLRAVQAVRAALPPVVTWISRRELPRLERESDLAATGPLGAGGHAARERGASPAPRA